MTAARRNRSAAPLVLTARTAADLMTPDPKSIRRDARVAEAIEFLAGRGFGAAPVIDEVGRPTGMVSRTGLLRSQQRATVHILGAAGGGSEAVEVCDPAGVWEVMTPAVFSVGLDTPARTVVESMLHLNVRRVFVVDDGGVLVGVISAFDVLRHLGPPDGWAAGAAPRLDDSVGIDRPGARATAHASAVARAPGRSVPQRDPHPNGG